MKERPLNNRGRRDRQCTEALGQGAGGPSTEKPGNAGSRRRRQPIGTRTCPPLTQEISGVRGRSVTRLQDALSGYPPAGVRRAVSAPWRPPRAHISGRRERPSQPRESAPSRLIDRSGPCGVISRRRPPEACCANSPRRGTVHGEGPRWRRRATDARYACHAVRRSARPRGAQQRPGIAGIGWAAATRPRLAMVAAICRRSMGATPRELSLGRVGTLVTDRRWRFTLELGRLPWGWC